jgi:ATP-binding cassette subfamily C protein CydC
MVFLRLLGFLKPYKWRVVLGILLGVATVASNVGLLATAAYVISAAAVVPFLAMLTIPVYLVRLFSVSRAASRYAERLVSHDVTFRLLAGLRTRFYTRLAPVTPARLLRYRSGDLLSRIVKDVEELQNVYLRSFSPVAVALAVCALAALVLFTFDPTMAFVAIGFLAATGVGVPLLVRTLSKGLGRWQLRMRAELDARIVDDVQGVQDVLAFGREGTEQYEVSVLNGKLGRVQRQMALVTGLQNALSDLMMNLALVTVLIVTIPLVAAGKIDGVFLAFVALVVLGSFEAVAPLGAAFQGRGRADGDGLLQPKRPGQGSIPILRRLHRRDAYQHRLRRLSASVACGGPGEQPHGSERLRLDIRYDGRPRVVEYRNGPRRRVLHRHLPHVPRQGTPVED